MEDKKIVELYLERNEEAISTTSQKYGRYCEAIAYNIIGNHEETEQCINNTLLEVWNSIPPNEPNNLRAYIGKIARNNALDIIKESTAKKRGGKGFDLILEELYDCSSDYSVEDIAEQHELLSAINDFLKHLTEKKRNVFVLRYWNCCDVSEIADVMGLTEANVYKILKRERKKLLEYLQRRGVLD